MSGEKNRQRCMVNGVKQMTCHFQYAMRVNADVTKPTKKYLSNVLCNPMSFHIIFSWFEAIGGESRVIPLYCRFVGYKRVHERR